MRQIASKKVIIVTGCSRGIGKATAIRLAGAGHQVYATGRKIEGLRDLQQVEIYENGNLHLLELDVTSESSAASAVSEVVARSRRIDVVVNNAGTNLAGTVEMISTEEMMGIINVNLLGVIRVLHEVLPVMRKQGSGHIVNISSAAGVVGLPGFDAYVISKFALEGLSEALWYEAKPFGINVSIIEPGPVMSELLSRTPAGGRLARDNNPYRKFVENVVAAYEREFNGKSQTPAAIAEHVRRAIEDRHPKLRYPTSFMVGREIGRIRKNVSSCKHLQKFARMIDL